MTLPKSRGEMETERSPNETRAPRAGRGKCTSLIIRVKVGRKRKKLT